jgi:hypothetical protein
LEVAIHRKRSERRNSMKKIIILGLMALFLFSGCTKKEDEKQKGSVSPKASDSFETNFAQFKSFFEAKDYLKAYTSLHSTLEMFWIKSPLVLNNVRFVKSDNNSYGIYTPKETEEFTPNEPIYLYVEPIGYTVKKDPKGFYEFSFSADFSLAEESGKVLGGQNDFANINFRSWNFNTEISLTFTYTFTGLEKGKYKITTVVKDKFSDKKTTTEKWISII